MPAFYVKASFNFSGGSEGRAPIQEPNVPSSIPELVRDVKL